MVFRILNVIGEKFTPEAGHILDSVADVDYLTPTQEQLNGLISKYDAVLLGLEVRLDTRVLENASNLKYIATATTGLDHIDTVYAESKGVKILSLKGENLFLDTVTGTAELAWGLVLSLLRFIPHAFDDVRKGKWERESFRGRSLYGKTLGVVGLGRLGKMVARYGKAFGMKVVFTDPHVSKIDFPEYEQVPFEKLLEISDIVSIHVHLSPQTENMFNETTLGKMKKSAFLVNTSRGKIVNEDDVLKALKRGFLSGYATDVLIDETVFGNKIPHKHPLVEYAKNNKNLILVPHIGGMTHESRETTDVFIAEKLKKYIHEDSSHP